MGVKNPLTALFLCIAPDGTSAELTPEPEIRMPTTKEQLAEALPYVPGLNVVNDGAKAFTGKDILGFGYSEQENKRQKRTFFGRSLHSLPE